MNILFVCSVYYPITGGAQDPIDQLGNVLASRGHRVDVLTRHAPDTTPKLEQRNGIWIHRIGNAVLPSDFRRTPAELRLLVQQMPKPDVIQVVGLRRPLPMIAELLGCWWNVPVIQTVGGYDIPDPVDPDPRKVFLTSKDSMLPAMRRADLLNAASDDLARKTELLLGNRSPVPTFYVGIDYELFNLAAPEEDGNDRPFLLSLRRLEPAKSVDKIVEAMHILRDEMPELDLVIAGEGSERRMLERYVDQLDLRERVSFLGEVPIEVAARLLRSAFATVVASKSEGGGLVNVEAQAAGCPVIATRAGGISEYLGDERGALYVGAPDGGEIADAVRNLWHDPDVRERIITAGRSLAEGFSAASLAEHYLEVYAELAESYTPREFLPWNMITAALWDDLALEDGREPALDDPWSEPIAVENLVLSTAEPEFRALGRGAMAFYYLGWASGVSTEKLRDVCRHVLEAEHDESKEAVAEALEQAADWGRFDVDDCLKYL
ncbi:glycosyltransferase family 4 protein [Actinopolyspora mortivallis]|uniref:glycosyltransferase family 4 protein n=1 Tax=Actinopolyspora mortivallis TaxID=33906 RepID=UPI000374D0C1|nr:glycosyltransferase family 4 protein [Actinopolyspora mortivallis]